MLVGKGKGKWQKGKKYRYKQGIQQLLRQTSVHCIVLQYVAPSITEYIAMEYPESTQKLGLRNKGNKHNSLMGSVCDGVRSLKQILWKQHYTVGFFQC